MGIKTFVQDPNDKLDYTMDWSAEMTLLGDTISVSQWFPAAPLVATGEAHTDTTATVFLSGGAAGESYLIANRITTAGGRIIERSMKLKVKEL